MKYTFQIYVNGYALPQGSEVGHASNKEEIYDEMRSARDEALRYGAAYESEDNKGGATARVWTGHLSDITDVYPDFDVVFGPRGGLHCVPC